MRRPLLPVVLLLLTAGTPASSGLLLELRVFNGPQEVTSAARITVHPAGDRGEPLAQTTGRGGAIELEVPPGIYDVQAIEERDGRVVNIQWAHRLVVMPYPDEGGRHLEVLNFKPGYGALQIRAPGGTVPEVTLYSGGAQNRVAGGPMPGPGYVLFVVPAGVYNVTVKRGDRTTRHTDVEVPRDRTRLWLVPPDQTRTHERGSLFDSSVLSSISEFRGAFIRASRTGP